MLNELVVCEVAGQNWAVANLVMEFCRQFHFSCRFGLSMVYQPLKDDSFKIKITPIQEAFSLEFLTASNILHLDLEKAGREFCGFKSRQAVFRVEQENGNYRFISEDYDGKCRCFESSPLIPK